MKKFFIKFLLFLITVLIIIYLVGTFIFEDRYIFNTKINGIDVSLKTEEQVLKELLEINNDYSLMIKSKNINDEELFLSDIGCKINIDKSFYDIFKNQKKELWFLNLIIPKEYNIDYVYTYNQVDLISRLKKCKCITEGTVVPENAYIKKDNSGYRIIKEKNGDIIDFDKFYLMVLNYFINEKEVLDLEKEKLYIEPEIKSNDENLIKELDMYKSISNFNIVYNFEDRNEIIDFKTYNSWISLDLNTNELIIDEDKVYEYVVSLAKKYDTLGKTLDFKSSLDGWIKVDSKTYGWKIDKQKTKEQLVNALQNMKNVSLEPIYTKKAMDRKENCIGERYIEISLEHQKMWFYEYGNCLVETDVVTGLPTEDRKTLPGVYFLVSRETKRTLGTYDVQGYETFVNYWMPFNGGQGIHDATWRSDSEFGGNTYKTNGSHGCVNTPLDKVKIIYENAQTGYPVIVY